MDSVLIWKLQIQSLKTWTLMMMRTKLMMLGESLRKRNLKKTMMLFTSRREGVVVRVEVTKEVALGVEVILTVDRGLEVGLTHILHILIPAQGLGVEIIV